MKYYVRGTYREDACNKNSAIAGLVLEQAYIGFTVHDLERLKPLADAGLLWVRPGASYPEAPVRIFKSFLYNQYVATTRPDGVQCNNLLALRIFYPSAGDASSTTYSHCSF